MVDPTLSKVFDNPNEGTMRPQGKTKDQVLRSIKDARLGKMLYSESKSHTLVEWLQGMKSQPQTRSNDLSHRGSVFSIARPAWGYPLYKQQIDDTRVVTDRLGLIGPAHQVSYLGQADGAALHRI